MNNRNYDCIIIISVISGLFITTCDYLVQMKTVETDYFVSRLLSLEETILNLSSFGWHYKIFCVNGNTGFRNESRIFYFIHLQNEEAYERKESSSA